MWMKITNLLTMVKKTHYHAPWSNKGEPLSICNDTMDNVNTTVKADIVDCKRCIKILNSPRGPRILKGNSIFEDTKDNAFHCFLKFLRWLGVL